MTLLVEKGTFTKTTNTSPPVDQTVTLNDSGLTPKAVILWSNGLTSTNTFAENYEFTYGFSDGTNDVCQRSTVEDNDTACVASYSFNNNCVISMCNTTTPTAGTETSRGDLLSFGAGNFHINWSTQSDANAKVIHYMVFGGTDISNVSVFQTTVGDTSTGNHSFNGSGTTFTPDMALTMTGADAYVTLNSLETTNAREQICLGAAKDTTHEYAITVRSEDGAANADTDMNFHNNACLSTIENAAGAENFVADFVSFNSAAGGGITVNVSNAAGLSTQIVAFMLIKGGAWDVDTFQQRSGTGTQDVTFASNQDPALVFLSGIHSATANSTVANNYLCLGGSDGTREGCAWCGDQNGAGLMVNTRKNLTTEKVFTQCTPNATAGSSTTDSEADMNDMATAGKFQLNWSTASATLGQMGYWALGAITQQNITRTLEETVSISESPAVARLKGSMRPLATETVTISESPAVARLTAKTRTITENTTIGETLARLAAKIRSLATEMVTVGGGTAEFQKGKLRTLEENTAVSDSVSRLTAKIRSITENTTIGESLTRLAEKFRTLATETVASSDSVVIVTGVLRSITENVTVGDSLSRLAAKTRTLSDTVSISSNVTRLAAKTRALATETVTVTGGTLARLAAKTRTLSDTVAISSSVSRLANKFRILATQVVVISDDVQRTVTSGGNNVVRTITENVVISENLARLATKFRTITETISISDSVTRVNSAVPPVIVRIFHGAGSGGRRLKRYDFKLKRLFARMHK